MSEIISKWLDRKEYCVSMSMEIFISLMTLHATFMDPSETFRMEKLIPI